MLLLRDRTAHNNCTIKSLNGFKIERKESFFYFCDALLPTIFSTDTLSMSSLAQHQRKTTRGILNARLASSPIPTLPTCDERRSLSSCSTLATVLARTSWARARSLGSCERNSRRCKTPLDVRLLSLNYVRHPPVCREFCPTTEREVSTGAKVVCFL